ADGRAFNAALVGANPEYDLAVLRIGVGAGRPEPLPIAVPRKVRLQQCSGRAAKEGAEGGQSGSSGEALTDPYPRGRSRCTPRRSATGRSRESLGIPTRTPHRSRLLSSSPSFA